MSCYFSIAGSADYDSEEWTNFIDRGGLVHIDDTLFSTFLEIELEVRKHLDSASETKEVKKVAIDAVKENEKVQYYWSWVSINWEESEETILFDMLVNHWITIRGFSYTGAFMEKYKQRTKKTVEKSKGLRKKLCSEGDADEKYPV